MSSRQEKMLRESVHTLFACSIQEAAKKKPIHEMFPPEENKKKKEAQIGWGPDQIREKLWCQLAEVRFSRLICLYKPIGESENYHLTKIHDHMHHIYDNEIEQCAMFLGEDDKKQFLATHRARKAGKKPPVKSYEPIYGVRPTLDDIDAKLRTWFDLEVCKISSGIVEDGEQDEQEEDEEEEDQEDQENEHTGGVKVART
ncbi:unnamed protein product [Caenorhabditis brenneri]